MSLDKSKPLLPLRDIVIFPSTVVPLFVGRKKSIKALEEVMKSDKSIVLVAQKNSEVDDPKEQDIYSYGCLSKILQLLKLPDGTVKVLVEGLERVKIKSIKNEEKKYLNCEIEIISNRDESSVGTHKINIYLEDEILSLEHKALDRKTFALGALNLIEWIHRKSPGKYSVQDVLNN